MASISTLNGVTAADLAALNDEDYDALRIKVTTEQERRSALVSLPQAIATQAAHFRAIGGEESVLSAAIAAPTEEA